MALLKENVRLNKATALIESLDDNEENNLIRYYISNQNSCIQEKDDKLREYDEFFRKLSQFLPNNHNIF